MPYHNIKPASKLFYTTFSTSAATTVVVSEDPIKVYGYTISTIGAVTAESTFELQGAGVLGRSYMHPYITTNSVIVYNNIFIADDGLQITHPTPSTLANGSSFHFTVVYDYI